MARRWWGWGRRGSHVEPGPEHGLPGTGMPAKVYVRAFLERAEITEEYSVAQEISQNPSTKQGSHPVGRIELAMPYDGHEFFTRAATDDVIHQMAPYSQRDSNAVIGHLLLKDYSRTNLREQLPLNGRCSPVAIEVPLDGGEHGGLGHLSSDRRSGATTVRYAAAAPEVIPAQLEIELFDPDSLDLPPTDLRALDLETDAAARRRVNNGIAKIAQHVGFRDELVLQIVVRLNLPAYADLAPPQPRVARVAIGWPTITSLGTIRIKVGDDNPTPVRYNPLRQCIEWDDVPMFTADEMAEMAAEKARKVEEAEEAAEKARKAEKAEKQSGAAQESEGNQESTDAKQPEEPAKPGDAGEPRKEQTAEEPGDQGEGSEADEDEPDTSGLLYYESPPMVLLIGHPGELYEQDDLEVTAEVRVAGYLLSGMDARMYDATGYYRKEPLALTTRIQAAAKLVLDDAFAKRDRSPSHYLFFDEIIPDEMRVTDITNALEDRGFTVRKVWPVGDGPQQDDDEGPLSWLYAAHRKVGPDDMILWILVTGRRFGTERETVVPGGVTHRTELPSGELKIVIRGSLPRDSEGQLTREMNVLHGMLRERYGRVRQRR